ncbi:putative oxidoreductase bli-4 mitochondrial [Colletotrichum asianum]
MPSTIKQDAMDLWGNVRIPILSDAVSNDWQHTTDVVGKIHYSALVGVPVRHNDLGNTTFSLESSYMFLECSNITRVGGPSCIKFQAIRSDDLSTAARIGDVHTDEYVPGPPNGTWHGYPYGRNASQTTNVGLIQGSPAIFENETDIEVHPARLLVQLQFSGDSAMTQPPPRMEVTCNVSQSGRVISQQPSQKPHAFESMSHLSFPRTFAYISQYLPIMESNEMSVYYLQDPSFVNMSASGTSGKPLATLDGVEDETIGIRLSQLLNTYLAIAQLSAAVAGEWMNTNGAALEPISP